MKKPQSLYLPILPHNRLAGYVENALGGAGTLSGLIGFIEEQTAMMLSRETTDIPWDHPANDEFEALTRLEYRHLHQPLETYTRFWNSFTEALPWFEEHVVGAHMLALHALTEYPSLWDANYRTRERTVHPLFLHGMKVSLALENLKNPHEVDVSRASQEGRSQLWSRPRPIFGRDRIDFITEDRREPISVYLDVDAHKTIYEAFGNRFFERLEHSLINLLENPDALKDIDAGAIFLEVGADGVDLDELERAALEVARAFTEHEFVLGEMRDAPTDEQLESVARSAGYVSLRDPDLLSRGLEKLYLRQRDVERTIGFDQWHITPDMSEGTRAVLNLGNDLDLIDGTDIRLLPGRIALALGQRFGITEIAPTRENAYRLLAARSSGNDDVTTDFINAVDLHMWELFTSYARHCLPHVSPGHSRISRSTLATLSEGDLFPHLGALEAFTGANVAKTPAGLWELRKGRRTVVTLDNREALRIADVLQQLVNLRDPLTVAEDPEDVQAANSTPKPEPYSYPVGPEIIEQARHVLSIHGPVEAQTALHELLRQRPPQSKQRATRSKKASSGGGAKT